MSIIIEAKVLEICEVDTETHQLIKLLQPLNKIYFPRIIAVNSKQIKQNINQLTQKQSEIKNKLEFLTDQKIQDINKLQLKEAGSYEKIIILRNYIEGLQLLQSKGICIFSLKDQQFLKIQPKNGLKILYYKCSPCNSIQKPKDMPKNQLAYFSIQMCYNTFQKNQKFIQNMHIWRWGLLASEILFQFAYIQYINSLCSQKQITNKCPQILRKNKLPSEELILNLVTKCLCMMPSQRPKYSQIIDIMDKLIAFYRPKPHKLLINQIKIAYLRQKQKINAEFNFSMGEDTLLKDQFRKKIVSQFVKLGLKTPKQFKPIFRAKKFNFNSEMFYSYSQKKGNLLILIDAIPEKQGYDGRIAVYLAPVLILKEQQGLFGHYIADPKCESFIYCPKNMESYKLSNKGKAFRYCPQYGPIVGDGDIILTSQQQNETNFPSSYQPGKHNKLPLDKVFKIRDYEVYQIIFSK